MSVFGIVAFATLACMPPDALAQTATRKFRFWQGHTGFTTSIFFNQLGGVITLGSPGDQYYVSINSTAKLFGGFYASTRRQTTGAKRIDVGRARMTLLRELLAAELNCAAFGCSSAAQSAIYQGSYLFASGAATRDDLLSSAAELRVDNRSGAHVDIPAGLGDPGKATASISKAIANTAFWDFVF